MAAQDWFSQNAPQGEVAPSSDWFAKNATKASGPPERRPDPNAGLRDPMSALSKATGIGPAPEDPNYRYPAGAPKGPGRFASEAYKGSPLNVGAVKDILTEFLRNPILMPVNIVNNTGKDIWSQVRYKALDHLRNNRPLDAVNDVILAFPIIGPAVRAGMEQVEKGDAAGGWGAIVVAMSQLAAPEAIARTAPLVASARVKIPALLPNRNPTQAAAVQAGIQAGIPVDLATASGSPFVRAVQQGNEFTPVGAIVESFARPKREAALTARAQSLADTVHPTRYTPEQVGESVSKTTQKAIDTLTKTADREYDTFRALAGSEHVDIKATQAALQPIYDELVAEAKLTLFVGADATNLRSLRQFMVLDDATVNIATADRALGKIKKLARERVGAAKSHVEALEAQVQAAAARAGQPAVDALTAGRDAIKARVPLRETLDQFQGSGNLVEPVRGYRKLVTADDTSIAFLREIQKVDPDLPLQTGRAWLEKNFDSVIGDKGFERMDRLVAEWEKLGPSSKPILFGGPQNVAALDQFMRLAKELNKVHNKSGTATMQIAAGSLAAGAWISPAKTIMGLLGSGALSAITRSPAAVRLLTQGTTKMLGPGRSAAPAIAKAAQAAAIANIMSARREAGIDEER